MFIPRAQPHAQSLFLFPIVFGINFYFLRIDDSEQCGTQKNVQHCSCMQSVLYGDTECGCRRQGDAFACILFFLCFPHRKMFRHLAFWLFWFCAWLLSPSHGHLAFPRSGYSACVVYSGKSQRHWKLQLKYSSSSSDYQSGLKGSLPGGGKNTGTLVIVVVSPRASKSVRSFRNTAASVYARPPQVADRRKSLGFSQTFL